MRNGLNVTFALTLACCASMHHFSKDLLKSRQHKMTVELRTRFGLALGGVTHIKTSIVFDFFVDYYLFAFLLLVTAFVNRSAVIDQSSRTKDQVRYYRLCEVRMYKALHQRSKKLKQRKADLKALNKIKKTVNGLRITKAALP